MDSLLHAAVEAEDILNGARGVKVEWSVVEGKMTWSEDKPPPPGDECRLRFRNALPPAAAAPSKMAADRFDIFRKLRDLYDELSRDDGMQASCQGLKTTSYLLEKLLARVNLNTLIINLYPGNKGYSLSLKINGNTQYLHPPDGNAPYNQEETLMETPRWPYEEEDLLSYIDNEELPVILLDLLEAEHSCLFYSGCIIAQIRDYRQAYPSFLCDTHHVLLRPTNQSIITDANTVGSRCGWGGEERAALEAALVLATAPPLCLEPRPAVGLLAARLHAERRLLNTPHIRRRARRFSQVAVNRKRKLDQFTHHQGLELLELINKQRTKSSRQSGPYSRLTSKYPKKPPEVFKPVEAPRMETLPLALPTVPGEALRLARPYERHLASQDCQAQLVEEYILETEKSSPSTGGGFFHIKLSILQRPSDQEYLGELYVDRDHVEGERNGAACRFSLGSRVHANKYIQQFTEIFTEEGRKSVRIKHIVPGQLPRISFTAGMREMQQSQQIVLQQRTATTSSTVSQSHTVNVPIITTASSTTPTVAQHTNTARSLPILQAQLQCGSSTAAGSVVGVIGSGTDASAAALKSQPSPGGLHLSPQIHDVQSSQPSANQLLAQQLTNPPQPLNPTKIQPAIIHIQPHPLMPSATQGQSIQLGNQQYTVASVAPVSAAQVQKVAVSKPRTTNPAISALVTSLMNSAHQFQQQASQNAAKSSSTTTASNNATILNLLNSAPAAMTHPSAADSLPASLAHMEAGGAHKALGRTVAHSTAPSSAVHTYTRQVMSGYACEDGSGATSVSSDSGLLERLMSGGGGGGGEGGDEAPPAPPPPAPAQHTAQVLPQQALHLPGLSLASLQGLQGIQGLQNVQVQIPGLAAPISLSLNVSGASGGLLVSVPPTTSVVLGNQPSVLSLPIAQLMSSGVKGGVRGGVQLVRARAPPAPRPARPLSAAPPPTANTQFLSQSQQQVLTTHQVRRKSNSTDGAQ